MMNRPACWIRRARLTAMTALLVAASAHGWAAVEPVARPRASAAAPRAAASPRVTAREVLRVADVVASSLATAQRIPNGEVVTLSSGRTKALTAGQLFVLLTRFLGTGYEKRLTPEATSLPPEISGPLATPAATAGVSREAIIAAVDLLAQARPTADVAESTATLPAAVWVKGQRLTPAQFMGALATILQYAGAQGQVPAQVAIGNYLPPLDWNARPAAAGAGAETPTEVGSEGVTDLAAPLGLPATGPPPGIAPTATITPVPPAAPAPRLVVYVPQKPPLVGEQRLTVEYDGPPAFVRVLIDGKAKAVSNVGYFTYTWDTRLEPDGAHDLRVVAVGNSEQILDKVEAKLTTKNGNLPLR